MSKARKDGRMEKGLTTQFAKFSDNLQEFERRSLPNTEYVLSIKEK
ncbi:hypothetical protein [Paenibacillus glycanilyticus]|uniref:Uncharacterized protein n=1 Tax=Paenibacillus glycanilyticus TaxID=126569 RepID=A0ABQ6NTI3_9BACL|nr:hypothetical protein [Paenibacillus glycanilyticus]GMK48371.1 hypothetical protein PghCCS26_55010 [Paenibacillus glycanilyticus]